MSRSVRLGALGLALFLLAWEGAVAVGLMPALTVPPPSSLPVTFWAEVTDGTWLQAVSDSLSHYIIGVAIGTSLGIAVGTAAGVSGWFAGLQSWLVRTLRPIPPLAWVPFAIIWFGISETAAAFVISIGVFWINYFTALSAVRAVDPRLSELALAYGQGGTAARLSKVVLPAALPGILGGVRAGLGQGWMTVVAAELFGIPGIGQRMMEASGLLATDVVMVYMLTIAFLYAVADTLFVAAERWSLRWQPA